MGIIELLSNVFGAIKESFGFASQRDAEKNTPGMVQAEQAKAEAQAQDKTREAISQEDLDELRKEASE